MMGYSRNSAHLHIFTIDTTIEQIQMLGRGSSLAKIDIKNAFRLLPVHLADCHLLAMKWRKQLYVDTCLPFGLRSTPKLFNILVDLLTWILVQMGVSPILHNLALGPPGTLMCTHNLQVIQGICHHLGVPLALGILNWL